MSCSLLERKTGVIENQNRVISEDLREDDHTHWQSIVWSANALGCEWRSLVALLSEDCESLDYRSHSLSLLDLVRGTVAIYDAILAEIEASRLKVDGKSDLLMCRHEARNIMKWIATWPTPGAERRQGSREEIAAGEFLTREEFSQELLQEAG